MRKTLIFGICIISWVTALPGTNPAPKPAPATSRPAAATKAATQPAAVAKAATPSTSTAAAPAQATQNAGKATAGATQPGKPNAVAPAPGAQATAGNKQAAPAPAAAAKNPAPGDKIAANNIQPSTPAMSKLPAVPISVDPFRALIEPIIPGEKGSYLRPAGLAGITIEDMRVEGVATGGPTGPVALVASTDDHTYFLRPGDRVYDGVVHRIDPNGVWMRSNKGADIFRRVTGGDSGVK